MSVGQGPSAPRAARRGIRPWDARGNACRSGLGPGLALLRRTRSWTWSLVWWPGRVNASGGLHIRPREHGRRFGGRSRERVRRIVPGSAARPPGSGCLGASARGATEPFPVGAPRAPWARSGGFPGGVVRRPHRSGQDAGLRAGPGCLPRQVPAARVHPDPNRREVFAAATGPRAQRCRERYGAAPARPGLARPGRGRDGCALRPIRGAGPGAIPRVQAPGAALVAGRAGQGPGRQGMRRLSDRSMKQTAPGRKPLVTPAAGGACRGLPVTWNEFHQCARGIFAGSVLS